MLEIHLPGSRAAEARDRRRRSAPRHTKPNALLVLISLFGLLAGPSAVVAVAGTWTTYTDASFVSGLGVHGDALWAGTSGGVLQWDLLSSTYVKYTASEGLADQNVKDVLIDAGGDVWFGTTEGVQRFDGVSWVTYDTANSPLPHNTVYAIVEDLDGAIWFGTAFGCAKLDGADWEVFTNLGGGATNVAVRGMGVDSQNRIWTANNPDDYGDPGGVSMYDGSTWIRFDPDPRDIGQYFLALTVDGNDHVWAGSWTNWVFMYDGLVWTHYDSGNSALVGHQIEALAAEDPAVVWIGNHASSPTPATGGVARFDGSNWTSYTPANSELPDRYVYSIAAAGGTAYFGTGSHGTTAFDGVNWDYYETANEPHCNYITSIEPGAVGGRDDALYFGTEYRGVAVFDAENWSSYTTENSGLGDDYVNDVHVADGVFWVGSQFSGVWKYDGQAWDNYDTGNSDLLGDIIVSLAGDSQGTLWLGTSGWDGPSGQDGAVARYDGLTWTNYYLENSGLIDDDALQVTVDLGDTIWIGTEEGVSKFDGASTWTNYDSGNSGLIENHVGAIAIDADNSKWFATQGGVSHLSGQTWTSYTTADGLPSNSVRDICISEMGVVWIATAAGVASFEEGLGWTAYTQGDGLGDDDVTAATVGPQGRIWFGTDRSGISVYDGDVAGVTPTAEAWVSAGMRVVASPNPFHAAVTIECALAPSRQISGEAVRVLICDVTGRGIRSLLSRHSAAGSHTVCWDGRTEGGQPVSAGVYLYRAESGRSVAVGRVLLVR